MIISDILSVNLYGQSSQQVFLNDGAEDFLLTRYLVCGFLYQKGLGGLKVRLKKNARTPGKDSQWLDEPHCHGLSLPATLSQSMPCPGEERAS